MWYIVDDNRILPRAPEIDYKDGQPVYIKNGFFLVSDESPHVWIYDNDSIVIGKDDDYSIIKKWVFSNKIQAEIFFLQKKLSEMQEIDFDGLPYAHLLPNTFNGYVDRLNRFVNAYPEYTI